MIEFDYDQVSCPQCGGLLSMEMRFEVIVPDVIVRADGSYAVPDLLATGLPPGCTVTRIEPKVTPKLFCPSCSLHFLTFDGEFREDLGYRVLRLSDAESLEEMSARIRAAVMEAYRGGLDVH
jgi:hypothetical protein